MTWFPLGPDFTFAPEAATNEAAIAPPYHHLVSAHGGKAAMIEDVEIPPFGSHAVEMVLDGADLVQRSFHVQQVIDGHVVGGNRVMIETAPIGRAHVRPKEAGRVDGPSRVRLAPWIAAHIAARGHLLGRR
jgi:hypothetical protein